MKNIDKLSFFQHCWNHILGIIGKNMAPQRYPCCKSQNLSICYITEQTGLFRCDYVKNLEMERLFWIMSLLAEDSLSEWCNVLPGHCWLWKWKEATTKEWRQTLGAGNSKKMDTLLEPPERTSDFQNSKKILHIVLSC